jgi:hypothetical protein
MMILTGLLGHGAAVCAATFSELKAHVQAASTPSKIVRFGVCVEFTGSP